AKSRRAADQVHRDIEHFADGDPHELPLRLADLVVKPAQGAAHGAAVVVLYEVRVDSRSGEFASLPRLDEESALVREHGRFDQHDSRNLRARELQNRRSWSRPRRNWPYCVMASGSAS